MLGRKKEVSVDVDKDLKAINEFLSRSSDKIELLKKLAKDVSYLRRQEQILAEKNVEKAKKKVFEEMIFALLDLLKQYSFFQLDVDISSERLKRIGKVYYQRLKDEFPDLLGKLKKEDRMFFE